VTPWLLGAGAALASLAAVTAAARRLRRRTPRVPLRLPVSRDDQEAVRGLVAGERRVEAIELLRRRYRLQRDAARAVADDVAAHADYPADWRALAVALDDELRNEVRRLVRSGRRRAAVRLVRLRFDLPVADADELVRALGGESPRDEE
jgi:hypothetical protein